MRCRKLAVVAAAVGVLPALALAGGAPQSQGFSYEELERVVNGHHEAVCRIGAELGEASGKQDLKTLWQFSKRLGQQTEGLSASVTQAMSSLSTVPYLVRLAPDLYEFSLASRALWDRFRDLPVYRDYLVDADVAVTLDNVLRHGEMMAGAQGYFYVYRCLQSVFYSMSLRKNEVSFKYLDRIPALFQVSGKARRMSCLISVAERLPEGQIAGFLNSLLPEFVETLELARQTLLELPDLSVSDVTLVDAVVAMNNKDAVQEILRSLSLFQKYGVADEAPGLNGELVKFGAAIAKVLDTTPACFARETDLALIGALVWLANDESDLAKANFADAGQAAQVLQSSEPSTTGDEFKDILNEFWREYRGYSERLQSVVEAMNSRAAASVFAFEHAIGLMNRAMPFEIASYLAPQQYRAEGWPERVEATGILAKMTIHNLDRRHAAETGKLHCSEWSMGRLFVRESVYDIYNAAEALRVKDTEGCVSPIESLRGVLRQALNGRGTVGFVLQMNEALLDSFELIRSGRSRAPSAAPYYYLLSNACDVLKQIEEQLSTRASHGMSHPSIQDCSERFATWDLYLRVRQAVSMVQEQIGGEISVATWARPPAVDHHAHYGCQWWAIQ